VPSTACVRVPSYGYTYTFSGVLSVAHHFSLKVDSSSESGTGLDYVNAARNAPDRVTLKVIESDVGHAAGWSARILQAMESLKRNRVLCEVSTPNRTYASMLLTEISVSEDKASQSGWTGSFSFTQFAQNAAVSSSAVSSASAAKADDRSSSATHTGNSGPAATLSTSETKRLLSRAGILGG